MSYRLRRNLTALIVFFFRNKAQIRKRICIKKTKVDESVKRILTYKLTSALQLHADPETAKKAVRKQ